jgi:hypothetical protein
MKFDIIVLSIFHLKYSIMKLIGSQTSCECILALLFQFSYIIVVLLSKLLVCFSFLEFILPLISRLNAVLPARVALKSGCEGVSAINTIMSVMGINLKTLRPEPCVEGLDSTP